MAAYQDRNIQVANNNLSGQYWGRGIAVVGGRDITIRSNVLSNIPYAAAVLLARETQSGSYGLNNIVVEKNTITDVQTLAPPYDFGNKFASNARTGHGAIEIHASLFVDEMANPALADGFALSSLAIRDNTITSSATPGVRVGVDSGSNWTMAARQVTGNATLSGIAIDRNALQQIRNGGTIQMLSAKSDVSCLANTLAGNPLVIAACMPKAFTTASTGAALSCSKTQ